MSKVYDKSEVEIRAKALLYSMEGVCPDGVWQELSYHLGEDFAGTRVKITNKLFSPRVLIIALIAIGAITLALLKFSGNLDFTSKPKSVTVAPKPQPVTPQVKKETPPPKPKVIDSAHIKDSLARVQLAHDSIIQIMKQTPPQVPKAQVPIVTKVDTAALKRYYARVEARRRRRDSLAAVEQEHEKHDTSTHVRRHHIRDSVISVKTDTVH